MYGPLLVDDFIQNGDKIKSIPANQSYSYSNRTALTRAQVWLLA